MKLMVNVYGERRHFVIPRDARKIMRLNKGDYVVYRVLEINDKPVQIDDLHIPPVIGKAMVAGLTSIAMSMYPTFKELFDIKQGDRLLIDVIAVIKKAKEKEKGKRKGKGKGEVKGEEKEEEKFVVVWRDDGNT